MTSNDIALREPAQDAALALRAGQAQWTDMQLAALGQLGVADASDGDKQVFLHVSQRTGLDPFSRQIYMIPRSEKKGNGWTVKWSIQTGIEGWRVIRDRAERRNGVRGVLSRALFYGADGTATPVWVKREPPVACEITYTVHDSSGETPYTSVLRYSEYCQTRDGKPVAQWAVKPVHMIEKCTEADVYRKAFPQDFSGVEMADAAPPSDPAVTQGAPGENRRPTAAQIRQQRQQVKAEVVDEDPETSPLTGDSKTAAPAAPASDAGQPAGNEPASAGAAAPPPPDDERHKRKLAAAHAQGKKLFGGDAAARHRAASEVIGADVQSFADLSADDLDAVARAFSLCDTPDNLARLLQDGEVSDGE